RSPMSPTKLPILSASMLVACLLACSLPLRCWFWHLPSLLLWLDRSLASPLVRQSLRKTNLFTKMLCWGITQIIPPGTWIRKTAISTVIRLRTATIRFQNQSPRRMALLSFLMKKRPGRKSSEQLFNWRTPPLPPLFHPVAGHHVVLADGRANLG